MPESCVHTSRTLGNWPETHSHDIRRYGLTKFVSVSLWLLLLVGCSKTVQWEEEVPLNTGETIWVKRSVRYVLSGASGNPLDIAYRPEQIEQLVFTWNQKEFKYKGDAVLMLLAISPRNMPVLVAPANWNGWDIRRQFGCTKPYYVQFTPGKSETEWYWPPAIEPWLYGMKSNLMLQRPVHPNNLGSRYDVANRENLDSGIWVKSPEVHSVDINYTADRCKEEK